MSAVNSPQLEPAERDIWRWRFADVDFDESTLELRVSGEPVDVEPKPLEFLMCLLRHSGEVVTKDELLEALWTGRVVTESVLTSCVAKLRIALRDETHQVIRTVHGYGYRLVAEVSRENLVGRRPFSPPQLEAGESPPQRPLWRLLRAYDGARGETWLAEHAKTGEKRVLKFAFDSLGLSQLKREITVHRLLRATLGQRDDFVRLLDWNLERPPYFIEFEHCAAGNLADWLASQGGAASVPLAMRLNVVALCAEALAAAHSAGVLHKDIKPANILMDDREAAVPRVCLADFGSGGILDVERLRALNITGMGFTQRVEADSAMSGTWSYMAPEVLAGQPPTVRSDVFSLGVLLYQLIIGDLHRSLAPGWERDVDDELLRDDVRACCDIDPLKRLGDAAELSRRLKSLPQRREQQAVARAAKAQAASLAEAVARGQVRRRWLTALAGVAGAGLAVTLFMYAQVQRARAAAEDQAAAARSVNDYLVRDLIGAANPLDPSPTVNQEFAARPAGQVPVRELLDRAAAHVAGRFAGQPRLEASVRMSLGDAYAGLAAYREAAQQFQAAYDRLAGGNDRDVIERATALHRAGSALREADDFDGAQSKLDGAMALISQVSGSASRSEVERLRVMVRLTQAWLLYKKGAYPEAIGIMQAERPAIASAFGENSNESATAYTYLANTQLVAGDLHGAEASARRALAVREQVNGKNHPRMIEVHSTLADVLRLAGKSAEAEQECRVALDMSRTLLGANHTNTLIAQGSLATLLQDAKRYDEAIPLFEDAVKRSAATYGEVTYETTTLVNNLGLAYADAGRTREAVEALQRSLASGRTLLGADHPDVIAKEHNLADVMADAGQEEEALALEQKVLLRAKAVLGPKHTYIGLMQRTMGRILAQLGRTGEARAALTEAKAVLVAELGPEHPQVQKVERLLKSVEDDKKARAAR